MPTSEFEKKIHRWASLICCFGSYRCLARVGIICNLLKLDLQMPGWGWKHLQLVGIGAADAYPGVGSICNLLDMNLQIHILGLEASAICWNWICRCISWGRKHLQLAGIGFVDAYRGEFRTWKYLQFASIGAADACPGVGSICN